MVFCAISHGTCLDMAICDRSFNEIIKKAVARVKIPGQPDDRAVSGHSLRVGAAQDLLTRGLDTAAIMRAGGWSNSQALARYLKYAQHNI
jgi:integrase/recombinase XerD